MSYFYRLGPKARFMNKLRTTLALAFALSVIIPVTIVVSITFNQARQHARDTFVSSMHNEVKQIDNAFSFLFKQIEDNVRFMAKLPLIVEATPHVPINIKTASAHTFEPDNSGSLNDRLYRYFSEYAATHDDLAYMYTASSEGGYLQWPAGPLTDNYDPRPRPWYLAAMQAQGNITRSDAYYWAPDDATIVSTVTQIKNNVGDTIGVLGMDISLHHLTALVKEFRYGESGYLMLVENNMNVLVDAQNPQNNFSDLASIAEGQLTSLVDDQANQALTINNEQYLVNSYTSPFLGWHFIGLIKMSEVDASTDTLLRITLLTTAVCLVLFIAISVVLSGSISNTILKKHDQLTEARQQAEQASEAKSNFLSTVSHEIRTPLNGIIGMAEILSDSQLNTEQRTNLKTLLSSGNSLLAIINDVLDMSKIEADALELEEIPFSLKSVFSSTFTPFATLATNKGIKLVERAMPENIDIVVGDPVRLRQILWNLLSNAIKFTEIGHVTVSVSTINTDLTPDAPDDHNIALEIAVADTGAGISKDRINSIFDPFAQEDAPITRKFGGTGLGLTIVKRIVDLMYGNIRIESEEGQGSSFIVRLPFRKANEDEVASLAIKSQTVEEVLGPGHKVLVAEDNPVNAQIATVFLEKMGCIVEVAENGRKAVELFKTMSPELIFMDVHMPDMDGITATSEIRALDEGTQIPIIGLTADVFKDHHKNFMAAGMNAVLTKPFKEVQLKAALLEYLLNISSTENRPTEQVQTGEYTLAGNNEPIGDQEVIHQIIDQLGLDTVQALLELALTDLSRLQSDLKQALIDEDTDKLKITFHTIKGSVQTLGAIPLASLAATLEHESHDLTLVQEKMPQIQDLINQTLIWWEKQSETLKGT